MQMSAAAEIISAELTGADDLFTGVSTDTRTINPGDLFVAIPGEKFDGHDYVSEAQINGAVGAMVDHRIAEEIGQLKVEDTTVALGILAKYWRDQFNIPVLAITGSNGKTSVTAMIREILAVNGNPLSPRESFNNQWGVPLTLLKLNHAHSHAVIEMGMNHAGEINYLSNLAKPDVALINNVAAAHLEGLGDLEQVAYAKAEIINGLDSGGILVLNAADQFYPLWKRLAEPRKTMSFGIDYRYRELTDVYASDLTFANDHCGFVLHIEGEQKKVTLPIPGEHNVFNALAAAAVSHCIGIQSDQIATGLANATGVAHRLEISQISSAVTLIDDSFNANPASTAAAIDVLSGYPGKRILVLGGMAELGTGGWQLHREIGELAVSKEIQELLVLADSGNSDLEGYLEGYGKLARCFVHLDDLVAALQLSLDNADFANTTVLIKGSKSSRMGRVVNRLKQ